MSVKLIALPVLALAALLTLSLASAQANNVEGRITGITSSTVTIQPAHGPAVTVQVVAKTVTELNGREVHLSALKVGDRGDADYNGHTLVASGIDARR
jgi:ABC-type Fe3+-hydroxamate transport system substrate-binding protein